MLDSTESTPIEVTVRGNVGSGAGSYARKKVGDALEVAHAPVLRATVVLAWRHNPASEQHALAEATVDVSGHLVRAKTSAPSMPEAVDELESRLRRQLVQLKERRWKRHRWARLAPTPGSRRRGDPPQGPGRSAVRGPEEPDVVRRKSFAGAPMGVDEAAYDMDLLGHDFFLYLDAHSKRPAVVHRLPGDRYAVRGTGTGIPSAQAAAVVHEPPAPVLSEAQARARLESGGEPFVFHVDEGSGEARVLYRRFDGNFGMISLQQ